MSQAADNERFTRTTRRQRTMLVAVVLLAAVALTMHATAVYSYRASMGAGSLGQRAAAARTAALLEPFRSAYAAHAEHLRLWALGEKLLAAGDYNRSVATLNVALQTGPDEPALVALYREASRVQSVETVKKAHLQHGHEGPGGTLKPGDIER